MVVLFLPLALLLLVSLRSPAETEMLLWLGTGVQAIVCLLALLAIHGNRELAGPTVIMVYVFALGLLLLGASHRNDWQIHFSQAVLLVVPLLFFAVQCLRDSGATTIRRARQLAGRLASRRDWPHDLMACRSLAEVKALREALHIDASPALELLANPRAAVRIAALAALEFRPSWRPGQPQVVLQLARRAPEPEVRAAAVCALANVDDRILIESLADLLRDSSPLVRQTATEALLWNTEHRWHWIRDAVRHALADPTCQEDGALKLAGNPLTKEAVADFHAWASEKGIIALRAALTLGVYYGQLLADRVGSEALTHLRKLLTDSHTPAMLRLELARLMNQYRELNGNDLRKLIASTMPAPVRLIAVEAMLAQGNQLEALGALHELARLPNREIALAIADLLQRRLGLDLGLPRDQAPPPIHSRMAAEVARRVLAWSAQHDVAESTPSPHEHPANYRPTGSEASSRVNL
jgi:hypothetical protein